MLQPLLKDLKVEHADFFGFSNGGNTTMQIAIRYLNLLRKIILGSAFFKRRNVSAVLRILESFNIKRHATTVEGRLQKSST
jgi:predicted esterase